MVWNELHIRFQGKKRKVLTVKSREVRRTSDKHIAWPKQTRLVRREVRRTSKCSSNNSETAGSNCFKVFWKILLQQKFLARTISWSTKRPQKLWKQRTKHLNVTIDDVTGTTIGKSSIQWRSLRWRWLVEWSGDRGVFTELRSGEIKIHHQEATLWWITVLIYNKVQI